MSLSYWLRRRALLKGNNDGTVEGRGWVLLQCTAQDDVSSDSDPSAISRGFLTSQVSEEDNKESHNNAIVLTSVPVLPKDTKDPTTCCELIIFSVATTGLPFSMVSVTVLAVMHSPKTN
jgi:hypothetical protein